MPGARKVAFGFIIGLLLYALALPGSIWASEPDRKKKTPSKTKSEWSSPIRIYQETISRADGDRCSMYPSCSRYALNAFKRHNLFTAWMLTCDRLLRCGHDEIHLAPPIRIGQHVKAHDPLSANTFWWSKP